MTPVALDAAAGRDGRRHPPPRSKVRVFTESFPSPYELTEGGGKTRLFMVLAIAQHRTLCPFRYVSDQPVQDEEFLLLRDQLKAEESRCVELLSLRGSRGIAWV